MIKNIYFESKAFVIFEQSAYIATCVAAYTGKALQLYVRLKV